MKNFFKTEIISPEKVIFSDNNAQEVVLPSYEGEMGILKDHTSILSFLKPVIVKILKTSDTINSFFVEDGIIECYDNSLNVLSRKILDIRDLNKEKINQLITKTKKILDNNKLNDDNRYLANHKFDALRLLSVN